MISRKKDKQSTRKVQSNRRVIILIKETFKQQISHSLQLCRRRLQRTSYSTRNNNKRVYSLTHRILFFPSSNQTAHRVCFLDIQQVY